MNDHRRDFDELSAKAAAVAEMWMDQIKKLAELHQEGILTDEEFTAKKQELLSRL